ncbi:MAG: CarD family transcriptional regulator [Rickettsiales bacterium]
MSENKKFSVGDTVVYPSHGVGTIQDIEKQKIGGMDLEFFVIFFEKEKMSLRVPVSKAKKTGLRHIINQDQLVKVFEALKSKPKSCKGMWSRRATEYEAKINSGELHLIAEVVRDLHKNVNDPDRSYSERVIYESALNRLISEISILENIEVSVAQEKVENIIQEIQLV